MTTLPDRARIVIQQQYGGRTSPVIGMGAHVRPARPNQ